MASNEDHELTIDTASDRPGDAPAPVKKVAAKRAPRKATKKASTPKKAPVAAAVIAAPDVDAAEVPAAEAPVVEASEPAKVKAPARKVAKRAPRKTAAKSAQKTVEPAAPADPEPVFTPATAAEVPSFGLLFQAPEPTAAPRRRRATAPVAAPEPAAIPEAQEITEEVDDSDETGHSCRNRVRRRCCQSSNHEFAAERIERDSGADCDALVVRRGSHHQAGTYPGAQQQIVVTPAHLIQIRLLIPEVLGIQELAREVVQTLDDVSHLGLPHVNAEQRIADFDGSGVVLRIRREAA